MLEDKVVDKLKGIMDPHTNTSLYDMGLISDLKIDEGRVSLTFTPSSPYCPIGVQLANAIKDGLSSLEDVKAVDVLVKGHVQEEQINEILRGNNAS
ncbi:MAG: iron-sulfur cluster assembly protein [Candidatus Hydrothermarchaeales archaeon]